MPVKLGYQELDLRSCASFSALFRLQASYADGKAPVNPSNFIVGAETTLLASEPQCGQVVALTLSSTNASNWCSLVHTNSKMRLIRALLEVVHTLLRRFVGD